MDLVKAKQSFFFGKSGKVRKGEVFNAAHPIVERMPDFFEEITEDAHVVTIEQATAEPGERSLARRTKAAAEAAEEAGELEAGDVQTEPEVPSRGASREAWATYAESIGIPEEDYEELKRDEIIALVESVEAE